MMRPSFDSPTLFTAVDLDTALESAVRKRETELREMERRKRELQELARQQRFLPSDERSTFKIINSAKELVSLTITLLASAQSGWVYVVPFEKLAIAELFGINSEAREP